MKADFRVAGGTEFLRYLNSLSARTSATVQRRVLRAAAEPMRAAMAILAPNEPGKPDLRDTMAISAARPEEDDLFPTETGVRVGPTRAGFYGFWQEFGTRFQRMQPFVRPAFEQTVQQSLAIIKSLMWAAISKSRGSVTGIQSGLGRNL